MVGIDSYFKSLTTSWVSRLTNNSLANWKVIAMKYFNTLGKNWLVFNMNIDDIKNLHKTNNLSAFYRDIIMCCVKTGGGQLPNSKYLANIRNQLIWVNKYIKVKGQSLLFNNWINSNLIYINDLLNEKGKLSKEFICKNLKCKVNWISEIYTFKKGLSREVIWNDKYTDINIFTNKLFYNSMIKAKATNPIGFNNWSRHLNLDEKLICHKYIRLFFIFCKKINLKFSDGN
jgi:hypothetical protein